MTRCDHISERDGTRCDGATCDDVGRCWIHTDDFDASIRGARPLIAHRLDEMRQRPRPNTIRIEEYQACLDEIDELIAAQA